MNDESPLNNGSKSDKIMYVMSDTQNDEIDLGRALKKLVGEWKIILMVMIAGAILSIFLAFKLSNTYSVDTIIQLSNADELGDFGRQDLIENSPDMALVRFLDVLVSPDNQVESFLESSLYNSLTKNNTLSPQQVFSNVRKEMSISRIKQDYYELDKAEKVPLKEIRLSLKSTEPDLASDYIKVLLDKTHERAISNLSEDILALKENQIRLVNNKLLALTSSAEDSRIAEIQRLEESNREQTSNLELQRKLKIATAKNNREMEIIRIREALTTAKTLEIFEPITWDDLRKIRETSQITNEFGGEDQSKPHYFQGERILTAELKQLMDRKDDKPFIDGLSDIESRIAELKNDPKISALKARKNDAIYIDTYDEMQKELYNLRLVPTDFSETQLMIVSQQPLISNQPTRSRMMIVLIGIILSGFLGLFIAVIRIICSTGETISNDVQ